jgi:glycine/D-amino acid oxidase-like deaminating enzyme
MSYKSYDFAVIGQGIAGTLLAYFLQKHGKRVLVIDNKHEGSSSKVAAGIVNPITGKKFVKSWRGDEFLPTAQDIYHEIGQILGIHPFTKANIIRSLDGVEDENNWLARTADTSVNAYMLPVADTAEFDGKVQPSFGYGEITGTFHVHLTEIIDAFKQKWVAESCYDELKFDHETLEINENGFCYQSYHFKEIIFCEGYQAIHNPFFQNIGLAPSKGEVLMVKIPEAGFRKMYKDKIFFVHQYDDVYWVGSGYEWNAKDDQPTAKSREMLINELNRVLSIPYEIIAHRAAIRPTMHNRRPVFLIHETITGMYMFNGLGTKGSSIGPYAARQFAE